MGCDFKPGDEVVCVRANVFDTGGQFHHLLDKGAIYTVAAVGVYPGRLPAHAGTLVVHLAEVENWCPASCLDIGFDPSRFRKVERKTDKLSIEAFLTIKPGFEEPRRAPAPAKTRERA